MKKGSKEEYEELNTEKMGEKKIEDGKSHIKEGEKK